MSCRKYSQKRMERKPEHETERAAKRNRAESENPLAKFETYTPNKLPDLTDSNKRVIKVSPTLSTHPMIPETAWFGQLMEQQLWIRKAYLDLWKAVQERLSLTYSSALIVIGNPGIGKSVGGINTVAALSIQDNPNRLVVVLLQTDSCYVFANGLWNEAPFATALDDMFVALRALAPPRVPGSARPQLLLLHDVKDSETFTYQFNFCERLKRFYVVQCVLFTSPKVGNYSAPEKHFPTSQRFYMPTWSLKELEEVKEDFEPPLLVDVTQRFREVGGVVRRFGDDCYPAALRKDRLLEMTHDKLQSVFAKRMTDATSTLFQLVPSEDHSDFSVAFLCDEARDEWFAARKSAAVHDALTLLKSAIQANCPTDTLRRHFENVVHTRLRYDDWRLLTVTYLGDGTANPAPLQALLCPPAASALASVPSVLRSAGSIATNREIAVLQLPEVGGADLRYHELTGLEPDDIMSVPGLYVSRLQNYPLLDVALVTASKEVWMFKVTVSDEHPPSKHVYDAFANHFAKHELQPRMVWVVFDDKGVSKLQRCDGTTPISMPQFALKLGITQTEVWVQQRGDPEPEPFSLLCSTEGWMEAELEKQKIELVKTSSLHQQG